jgi:transposase
VIFRIAALGYDPPMLGETQALPEDPAELRAAAEGLVALVKAQALRIAKLEHQLAGLRRHRFGSTAESLDQLQLRLEDEEIAAVEAGKAVPPADPTATPKGKPRRKPLPADLPRQETVLAPGDACGHCGGRLKQLGEDVTEELDYVPGRFVVNRIVRPRLACTCCEAIHQAPLPARPIERGRPGPGLLARVLVAKYGDHLPLHRQSQIFARDGIDLDRSTLAGWVGKSTALLEPLADAIGRHVLGGAAIFVDDTPMKLQAPGDGKTTTARIWTYVRDERPWLGPAPPAACYRFSVDRKGEHPADHLAGYRGWMHADGYAGFNELFRSGGVREVACLAHTIRTQCEFRERSIDAGRRAAQGNDMVDLQAVLMNDDALDHQLQDRLLLGDAGRVQPRTDAFAKGGEAHQRVLGPRPSFA